MTKKQIKQQVQKIQDETGCTFIEACQAMQAAAAKLGREDLVTAIHKVKMTAIKF